MRKQISTTNTNLDLTNIDHVPSSGTHSRSDAVLYVFEDNEAVIQDDNTRPESRHETCVKKATELLWIDCLAGLILSLKFGFDTLTPNINSQTLWPKVISHVTSGIIFFIFQHQPLHLHLLRYTSSLISCSKKMAKRMLEQKGEEVWQNRNLQRWTCLHLFRQVPHRRKFRLHPIAQGILIATVKLERRMRRNSKSDAASSSQARLQDAYLGGSKTQPRWNLSLQKKNQVLWIYPNLKPGVFHEEAVSWRGSNGETRCLQNSYRETSSIQQIRKLGKSKSWKKRMATQSTHVSSHSSWRHHGWFGRDYGYLGHISQQFILIKTTEEFTTREEESLEYCGTVLQWNWKTDAWSNRNQWCDHHSFQRTLRWDREAHCAAEIVRSQTPKLTSSPTLCSVCEKSEMIRLLFGRAKINGIQKIITSKNASTVCRRSSSGKYSQESQRWASRTFNIWWETYSVDLGTSTTGSSSCQCTTTLYGEKKETERCEYKSPGSKKRWSRIYSDKPDGSWDRTAEMMNHNLHGESCHPIFRASSAFDRGESRSKGHGKKSVQ